MSIPLKPTREPNVYIRTGPAKTTYYVILPPAPGATKQDKTSHPTFEAARDHKIACLHRRRTGDYIEPSREPFGAYFARWCDAQRGSVKPVTVLAWRQARERASAVHEIPLCDLSHTRLQQLVAAMIDSGLARGTIQQTFKVVRRCLRDAMRQRLIRENPADGLAVPKVPRFKPHRLTSEEVSRFRDAIADDDRRALWETALETGMRYGELAALRWEDVDLDAGIVFVRVNLSRDEDQRPIVGTPKSDAGTRPIAISDDLVTILTAYRDDRRRWHGEETLVFPGLHGGHQTNKVMNDALTRVCARAGVTRVTMHGLRHSSGTEQIEAGIPVKTVAERMGHSHVGMTLQLYVHPDQAAHRRAAEMLSKRLRRGEKRAEAAD